MPKPSQIFTRRVLLVLFITAAALWAKAFRVVRISDAQLSVYVLDTGQGDSILVRTKAGVDLLIDGGPDDSVLSRLSEVMPGRDRSIEVMLLTHPHADHVAGLVPVLENYEVGQVWSSGSIHTTDIFLEWLQTIKDKGIPFKIAKAGEILDLGDGITFTVLYPFISLEGVRLENANDGSVVGKLVLGNFSMLLTGDAETTVQDQLFSKGIDLRAKILKVPHQGSSDAVSKKFLGEVKPEIGIIPVGKNNPFHHPHPSSLKILEEAGVQIYRTDLDGTISILTDGVTYSVSTH